MVSGAGRFGALAAALMTFGWAFGPASDATAQQTVKIGAIYPLSGNAASAGNFSKAAIELAVDIINNGHPELKDVPLAAGKGLPGLGGAKVEVVFADNQGTPAAGQNQALRLITEEKVHALIGAYQSGITVTASAMAERHGIPFLTPEFGRLQPDRARLQVVLPRHAGGRRLRARLFRLSSRSRGAPARRSARSPSSTRTPSTATRSPASSRRCSPRTASTSRR